MDRRKRPRSPAPAPEFALLAQKLVQVPDKLLIVQMHLQPFPDNPGAMSRDPYALAEACNILQSAIADVVDVARSLQALSGIEKEIELMRSSGIRLS